MAHNFEQMDLTQLQNAAKAIGWTVDSELRKNKTELAHALEFQYRWRAEFASIADRAGGVEASEVPELPYDAERIQVSLAQLQPKIRRTQQKKWGWLGFLVVLPVLGSVRCVQVNQSLLATQTEVVRGEFEQLNAETEALGWSVTTPDTPTWADLMSLQKMLEDDRALAEEVNSVRQLAGRLGYELSFERPYTYQDIGDYSIWRQLVEKNRTLMHPFSFLKVPMASVQVSDANIERRFVLNHGLWVMSQPVASDFWMGGEQSASSAALPIEVRWDEAISFANQLSQQLGLSTCYQMDKDDVWRWENESCMGYRLPTELELIQIQTQVQNTYNPVSLSEWAWDMYDSSWLWNMPKNNSNPRIDSVNIANPSHVRRSRESGRNSGDGGQAAFRLVRRIQD